MYLYTYVDIFTCAYIGTLCAYIGTHACTLKYNHVGIYGHKLALKQMCVCVQRSVCISIHTCIHTYMTYIHTCIHTYMRACVRTSIHPCMHARIHTYTHTRIHSYIPYINLHYIALYCITLRYNTLHALHAYM